MITYRAAVVVQMLAFLVFVASMASCSTGNVQGVGPGSSGTVDKDGRDGAIASAGDANADGGDGGDGSDAPKLPSCYGTCKTPSDCIMESSLHDADNYSCTSGRCVWLGCTNDEECKDALYNEGAKCGP